jgi:hypothetical protein
MQLDALLEVAVGLVFTWLVLSVATVQAQDTIGRWLNWRANFLEQSIGHMLKNPYLVTELYNEPLIEALGEMDKKGRLKKPTNIPNATFAAALLGVIMNAGRSGEAPVESMSIAQIRAGVKRLKEQSPDLARALDRVLPGLENESLELQDTLAKYHKNIANWFDTVMNQASGWYKARAQTWAFVLGLGIAVIFHIDTLHITHQLWREPTLRAVIVANAQSQGSADQQEITNITETFESLAIPVGWSTVPLEDRASCVWPPKAINKPAYWSVGECRELTNLPAWGDGWGWIVKLFGLVVSGFAAMQGAPFWFDILRKLVGFREKTQPPPPPPAEQPAPPPTLPAPPSAEVVIPSPGK